MQTNKWLDSSSVYSQQHSKFYLWVLYPIGVLFFLLGLFLVFARKEVVNRIAPKSTTQTISKLQAPIETQITENYLYENKVVKKGEIVVVFDTLSLENEQKQFEDEVLVLEEQKKAAQTFIISVENNENQFVADDSFGYPNQLNALFAEQESLQYITQQATDLSEINQEAYKKTEEQLDFQLTKRLNAQSEWEQVKKAWGNQQEIQEFSTEIISKYKTWQLQVNDGTEEQKNQVIGAILSTIDENIGELKKEIEQIQGEKAKLIGPITSKNEINSENAKVKQNKEQLLAKTKQDIIEFDDKQKKIEVSIKQLKEKIQQGILKAPIGGTISLNEEFKTMIDIPKGALIAEIYPTTGSREQTFTAQLPANEMTRIKKGMNVHFTLDKKGVAAKIVDGKLTGISETSETTENGTFYTVTGKIQIPKNFSIRYGLTGEISLIVGKKTYWQQIKDTLLNVE
uniref:Accessory protein CbaC n=1 Tax=Carnobacterium maltaromaticum TaxID=2751 RepID=Q9REY2_CARML|nr:accessory protein CbaC [Carnobacterium maltaromaticum]